MFKSARYQDEMREVIIVVTDAGITKHVPDDMANADRQRLAEWVKAGGVIEEPPAPPVEEPQE